MKGGTIKKILKAAKANNIPDGRSGLWSIRKDYRIKKFLIARKDKCVTLPPGEYTYLHFLTTSSLHTWGEIVMEDTPFELETHLNFMCKAYGNVLVTGLGLGCVARGLLANPNVKFVTCIEKSEDVLNLVKTYMPQERLKIIHADALEWVKRDYQEFDCAYHDLWTNREKGEPHLSIWHSRLIKDCFEKKVKLQGAWAFPREVKRGYKNYGMAII